MISAPTAAPTTDPIPTRGKPRSTKTSEDSSESEAAASMNPWSATSTQVAANSTQPARRISATRRGNEVRHGGSHGGPAVGLGADGQDALERFDPVPQVGEATSRIPGGES